MLHNKKRRMKTGLKAVFLAQQITSQLDESVERNLDYVLAVNTLTGYLLLTIEKPNEAYEFLCVAERVATHLGKLKPSGDYPEM
jgi:hypothetical protein